MPPTLTLGQRVREAGLLAVRNMPGVPDRRREPWTCRGGQVLRLRGDEAYVAWDPITSFVDGESQLPPLRAVEWVDAGSLALEVVHVLHQGLPLCGFSRDLPRAWPDGHVWTRLGSTDPVSCKGCAAQAREIAP